MAAATLRAELPSSFIDLFEKSIARAKDTHEKVATIVEHSTEAFGEAFSCANRGSAEYRVKLMEIARDQRQLGIRPRARGVRGEDAAANCSSRRSRISASSSIPPTAQMKELSALTQKVVSETTEPIRHGMAEPFKMAS